MITRLVSLLMVSLLLGCSAKLQRPDVPPSRTLEPPLATTAAPPVPAHADARAVYIAPVQSRIGRRVLHARPGGEVVEDAVWSWSARPDRYLDTALHLAAGADPGLRIVERADALALHATLLSLSLGSASDGDRLAAVVELRVTGPGRTVTTRVLRADEPVSGDLPANAAAALALLMHRLARETLVLVGPES